MCPTDVSPASDARALPSTFRAKVRVVEFGVHASMFLEVRTMWTSFFGHQLDLDFSRFEEGYQPAKWVETATPGAAKFGAQATDTSLAALFPPSLWQD